MPFAGGAGRTRETGVIFVDGKIYERQRNAAGTLPPELEDFDFDSDHTHDCDFPNGGYRCREERALPTGAGEEGRPAPGGRSL
ncbi:hypothetical protein [Desulfovirgula thermocuniculi]|uniref:hypothetical protein n=1 Tax=Desulfovirgula thermocuniculi TaxID=348842 RepID=UPI00041B70F1|nr:hypothetical protein [Desulfovirgula thermocuniculi]